MEVVDTYDQEDIPAFLITYRLAILYPHFRFVDDLIRSIPSYADQEECTLHVILEGMEVARKGAADRHLPRTAAFLRFGAQTLPFFT